MTKPLTEQAEYLAIIKQIDDDFKIIKNSRPLPQEGIRYFLNEFSIEATHNSNAIEGNTFTYDETKLLIEKGITAGARSFRENQEIVGYKKGFDYLYKALRDGREIDEEFIKKIHSYVLYGDEDAGRYRIVQNFIGNSARTVYTPCSPKEVPEKMAQYVKTVNDERIVLKEAISEEKVDWTYIFGTLGKHHIEFESIHSFIDGNGRAGRLLMTYEMILLGLLPVDIRYEKRDRYYAAISAYHDKEKYSVRPESKTEKMAKLIAESELASMSFWIKIFKDFLRSDN